MAAEVSLPGIGPVDKKWVYVGGAITATIVGIAWWRHLRGGAAASPVADPATGSTGADAGFSNPVKVGPSSGAAESPSAPASDQEWTQRVLADFRNLGQDSDGVLAVLGKYLSHQALTSDEAAIVRQAWAFEGRPPGNQEIILATGGSTPGTPAPPAGKLPPPTGLYGGSGMFNRVNGQLVNNYIDWGWNEVAGADHYHWEEHSAFGSRSGDVKTPGVHETDLAAPNADHYLTVWAVDAKGQRGDPATTVAHTHDNSF
jgi:hypothetical protein